MTLFVDTSAWSLAFRRDRSAAEPEVRALKDALLGADIVGTTDLIFQKLLPGFSGPKASVRIVERFAAQPLLHPDRDDHIAAAELGTTCRRAGVKVGTVDALLAQLCVRHDLVLLSTDKDFTMAAKHCPLQVWSPGVRARAKARKDGPRR